MTKFTLAQLLGFPYMGVANAAPIGDGRIWDDIPPEAISTIQKKMVRAAGFVYRDFEIMGETNIITILYGWQTHRHHWMVDHLKPLYWRYLIFGRGDPVKHRDAYGNLGVAMDIIGGHWIRPDGRSEDRRFPLVWGDLGPCVIDGRERISPEHLREFALAWNKASPVLKKEQDTHLDAFFCIWEGHAYVLTVPFYLYDINYGDVERAGRDTIHQVCGNTISTSLLTVPLWYPGTLENLTAVGPARKAA